MNVAKPIQGLIVFSTALGVAFLWQAYPLLPSDVFTALLIGWLLFVVDSVLTFVKPRVSYVLALALAVVALSETLGQPEHYALIESGNVPATVTLILGSAAQVLLIVLVGYFFLSHRTEDPWAWPNGKAETPSESDVAPT